jgi:2-amino-4-hydroxy-6-hydroxymethyldihydropteridine diphosphokinase
MEKVYLLLGTNIGDLEENLHRAIELIAASNIRINKISRIYKTKPWGVTDQPDYLNVALEVESDLSASELLRIFKHIEQEMGREQTSEKWQPRVIDIDIIFWGDHVVEHSDLKIPHQEFFSRPFAMKILAEIAPEFIPPGSEITLEELSSGVCNEGIEVHCS